MAPTDSPTPAARDRVVLLGWGAIGRAVAARLSGARLDLVGIAVRDAGADRPGLPDGVPVIDDPDELGGLGATVVAEAAGRASVLPWGRAALSCGADLIVSSVSAFADPEVLDELSDLATATGGRIHIQPGALAGVDALSAARTLGLDRVEHRMVKPPHAWRGTPAEGLLDLETVTETVEFHRADAATTAAAFPKNANVAMTTALAGIGPEATIVTLVADPSATTNRHEITASGGFGDLEVRIANQPLPANPKSSAMAALGLLRAIENRTAALRV